MAQVIALARRTPHLSQEDFLRSLVVCGCALALILARITLPLI
jgi:hypothetical protein